MTFSNRVLRRIALLTVCGVLAAGPVVARIVLGIGGGLGLHLRAGAEVGFRIGGPR